MADKIEASLVFGGPFTNEKPYKREVKETQAKRKLLWWQKKNLMYTATGYGSRIPTEYMVKHNNRWKRVYCRIYSNSGVLFIESKGKPCATVDIYPE